MTQGSNELHFFYDAQNKPAVVVYNGTSYSYVKNLQGDIVAILDSDGSAVVRYKYDAWGRQIGCDVEAGNGNATALSTLNPFRYRGYVYDEETELYYLRSRYYSVHHYRFVNADGIITRNIYAYCSNKPVILKDKNGYAPTSNKFSVCMYDDGGSVVDNSGNSLDTPYAKEGDGNYYRHDRDDLYFEHAKLHRNISKEDVQKWYNSLSRDDYPTAGLVLSILPIPSLISFLSELFSIGDDMSPDATTDPQGNVLYIEEGYSIVELRRVYMGDGYSATETEYFVYDLDDNLVFNTTIRDTYITD